MGETTRADREAFAREYWPGGVARGTSGDVWVETGKCGNPAWDAGARAIAGQREMCLIRSKIRARTERAELLRLAAQVAVKVGEHEYARGRREGAESGFLLGEVATKDAERWACYRELVGLSDHIAYDGPTFKLRRWAACAALDLANKILVGGHRSKP